MTESQQNPKPILELSDLDKVKAADYTDPVLAALCRQNVALAERLEVVERDVAEMKKKPKP